MVHSDVVCGCSLLPSPVFRSTRWFLSRKRFLEEVQELKPLAMRVKFNKHQCANLASKLSKTVEIIMDWEGSSKADFGHLFEDLYRVVRKVKAFVKENERTDWLAVAINMNDEEAFNELLLEVKICYTSACCLAEQPPDLTFNSAADYEIKADQELFCVKASEDSEQACQVQARYLQNKLSGLHDVAPRKFDEADISDSAYSLPAEKWRVRFSQGAFSRIDLTEWMGQKYAIKTCYDAGLWFKEVSILAELHHPNVMNILDCGKFKNEKYYIAMEIGQWDLHQFIVECLGRGSHFRLPVAFDIIFQIARGMRYLHKKQVAHFDLKPSNVLVTDICRSGPRYHVINVKIIDFSTSIRFEKGKGEEPTQEGRKNLGTSMYMAPEVMHVHGLQDSENVVVPFKADVYSYAMTCYEILAGKMPFEGITRRDMLRLKQDWKPSWKFLESKCLGRLSDLKDLIVKCSAANPAARPCFESICSTLEKLKTGYLIHGGFRGNDRFRAFKSHMLKCAHQACVG